jgi:hypothetical protein
MDVATTSPPIERVPDCLKCQSRGQSPVRVEGRCEHCFIEDFIDPIKREIRNSEEIIQRLHDREYTQLQRLQVARKVQVGVVPRNTYKCSKGCGFVAPFGGMYQLIWHEENCKHIQDKKAKARRVDAGQRKLKVVNRVASDEDDDVFI